MKFLKKLHQKSQKNLVILIGAIIICLELITILSSLTPQSQKVSPFSRTQVGITTDQEVMQLPGLKNKLEATASNATVYQFPSPLLPRDNLIITRNGKVVFERAVTIDSTVQYHPSLSQFANYGKPDAELQGSAFYGKFISHLIYTKKGLDLIANPFTGEIFEINTFAPMSVEEYKKTWGVDIYTWPTEAEEKF